MPFLFLSIVNAFTGQYTRPEPKCSKYETHPPPLLVKGRGFCRFSQDSCSSRRVTAMDSSSNWASSTTSGQLVMGSEAF